MNKISISRNSKQSRQVYLQKHFLILNNGVVGHDILNELVFPICRQAIRAQVYWYFTVTNIYAVQD